MQQETRKYDISSRTGKNARGPSHFGAEFHRNQLRGEKRTNRREAFSHALNGGGELLCGARREQKPFILEGEKKEVGGRKSLRDLSRNRSGGRVEKTISDKKEGKAEEEARGTACLWSRKR